METPVTHYTGNNSAIRRAAEATVKLANRAAWTAIPGILVEAGVPAHTALTTGRNVAWEARKRLRRRRRL